MNTMIKIALFDENRYFSAGWQEALALHFSTYGKRTLLLDAQQVHEADLVFCYFPPGVQSCFCHFFEAQTAGRKTLYFRCERRRGGINAPSAPAARWRPASSTTIRRWYRHCIR